MTKIIDFETKGNVIRFYLGADNCNDYWGDDWDDTPYEHNAGEVYDRFVVGHADIYVDMDLTVYTPDSDWHYQNNSPFCKEDFKNHKAPCIIIAHSESWGSCYRHELGNRNAAKFYFEDRMEPGKYFFDRNCLPKEKINFWTGKYLVKEN